ncbi:hypothetical protein GWI33_005608 [Rhynchophorus ferrugineus]|uniref:Uncharacterized protein n=1 Tax=Rhynchophorus ferrugineus TaxID=354439 RepID=A0A834IIY9_RHYFE|nr:hypothetical protein GWI33_005608 [Rhynchophorus ferrugineus]
MKQRETARTTSPLLSSEALVRINKMALAVITFETAAAATLVMGNLVGKHLKFSLEHVIVETDGHVRQDRSQMHQFYAAIGHHTRHHN